MDVFKRLNDVVQQVTYKDWRLVVRPVDEHETHFYLQVCFIAKDVVTGAVANQRGRKWLLSEHMTDTEIVVTAYKAIEAAELHEMRENFKFKGEPIYSPHLSVNDLVDCRRGEDCLRFDARTEPA